MSSLTFEDVSIVYGTQSEEGRGEVAAVKNVNLVLPEGGSLGIAGESGSGKSTLAMSVLRLLPRNARVSGRILVGEKDVTGLSWGELRVVRWGEAAIVFQGAMHSLNPVQRVGRQITEALAIHVKGKYGTDALRERRAADLLKQVDLQPHMLRSFPHELSGGQKQRIMIAMALACEPQLIIADEPTTALDVVVQDQVLAVLTDLIRERGISLVMISHDLSVLAKVCTRIAVMYAGEVVELASAHDIMTDPQHPHTRALAAAFPLIGDPESRLNPVSRHGESMSPVAVVTEERERSGDVLLSARNLNVAFHGRAGVVKAVDDVSLECRAGEITALVGQSGSGKTTLAHTLLGLQAPDSGEVLFRGKPLAQETRALKEYRRDVQLILQDPSDALNPKHSVYESVAEGIRIHSLPGDERDRVSQALSQAELTPPERFFGSLPQELSGGQRQRVVIAGALALGPQFLVADEPVASLDASVRGDILALLLKLKRELGLGALVITHDLGLAWNIADRVIVMHKGRLVESGAVKDVLLNPQHSYTRELLSVVPTMDSLPS
ncbi:ABC transporter ATP-binding protein [Microbacterium esteraromaticum]|uniref:ABC transporter ATP-binding protein n=1 Tax=Microbacterium esteraromaticum TaxID=57043 RepID=A0A7D7WGT4_9MICO|nr:ABC transporter ATP-binding protein [Microbacterium esteraromaticum]QMU97174.1 ABC transporter ATP-binding protein [Microbacterium esteraromaticum]